jgi:DNA-binding response OmpR family regulator
MRQLRQKLEPDNAVARLLITEPSVGYRLLVVSENGSESS